MRNPWNCCEKRILELLVDQAAFGLTAIHKNELNAIRSIMPEFDLACMEQAAENIHLASVTEDMELMPISLHQRILQGYNPELSSKP